MVKVRIWPKKCAKRGLRVGRLAATIPMFISTLWGVQVNTAWWGDVDLDHLLLPDIVPGSMTTPIFFLEEVGLHGRLVDRDC